MSASITSVWCLIVRRIYVFPSMFIGAANLVRLRRVRCGQSAAASPLRRVRRGESAAASPLRRVRCGECAAAFRCGIIQDGCSVPRLCDVNCPRPVRSGVVRFGPVRSGPVRFGAVRSGAVRSGPVRCGPVWCVPVRSGAVLSGLVRFGRISTINSLTSRRNIRLQTRRLLAPSSCTPALYQALRRRRKGAAGGAAEAHAARAGDSSAGVVMSP